MATTFTEFFCDPVTSGASNLNAGTRDGINEPTAAAAFTYTNATSASSWDSSTGIFTVSSGNPSTDGIVANTDWASVYVTAGATTTGFVGLITAVTSTTITVSLVNKSGTAPATSSTTDTTLKVGGRWQGPNGAVGFPFNFAQGSMQNTSKNSPRINLKNNGNYAITAGMTDNQLDDTTFKACVLFEGFTSTPGDGGKATIDGGSPTASYTMLSVSTGKNRTYRRLIFQNNCPSGGVGGSGSGRGIDISSSGEILVMECVFHDIYETGLIFNYTSSRTCALGCEAYKCNQGNKTTTAGFRMISSGCVAINCISHHNDKGINATGFALDGGIVMIRCIAHKNAGFGASSTGDVNITIINSSFYDNSKSGILLGAGAADDSIATLLNNAFVKNTLYGMDFGANGTSAVTRIGKFAGSAYGSGTKANGSGNVSTMRSIDDDNPITLTADITPWVDPDNGNFTTNLSVVKGTGYGYFVRSASTFGATVGYPDIGI